VGRHDARGGRRRWLVRAAVLGAAAAGAPLALTGCGGGADRTKARLRLVNASAYVDGLDLTVDGARKLAAVRYGADPNYLDVDPDRAECRLARSGSPTSLVTLTPALTEDRRYTLLAWGPEGGLRTLLIDDELGRPDRNRTKFAVVQAAPDAEALDVYVTGTSEPLAAAMPVHGGLAAGGLGTAAVIDSGTWRVRVTAAGSKTDVRLDLPAVRLDSEGVATLVITPSPGGALVNALLLRQQGAIERLDNPEVRVRVVAGLPTSASVSVEVDGQVLAAGQTSPSAGRYLRIPANATAVRVAAGGNLVEISRPAFAAGADYTLLVHGTQATPDAQPRADWLADDNRPPADTGSASLRLAHGVSGLADTQTLALTADFVPVASGVVCGTASAYDTVTATATARLTVTASGLATPLADEPDQPLVPGGVYTLFVVGDASAPAAILRRDR
jgi:hypothetical protein